MNYKPNATAWPRVLLLLLPLSYGCAQVHAVALDCPPRPVLPVELAKEPPPQGIFLACLTELSQGTSVPSCVTLRSFVNK
jgi:hypothetical protein